LQSPDELSHSPYLQRSKSPIDPSTMEPVYENTTFVHNPLRPEGRAIRLLNLQPSSDPSSNIKCTLQHVNLDDHPTYKALSYTWGDPDNTAPILVDDKKYYVTVNCEAALCRLRETNERCLWIDAICINQKDNLEKTTQIPLMRDIYAFADEVIVWLGHSKSEQCPSDEARERIAFGQIEDLSSCEDSIKDFPSFVEFALRGDNPISRWQCVREIYTHSWFDRLWVHQEITVAEKASVLGQHYSTSWDKLARTVLILYERIDTRSLLLEKDPTVASWTSIVMGIVQRDLVLRCLHRSFRQQATTILDCAKPVMDNLKDGLDLELSLFHILKATRSYKCHNPLDRVFAILGLVEDDMGLRPNYNQTISELFTDVTWMIIQKQQSLEALCMADVGNSPRTNSSDLPSWVIDWRLSSGQPARLDYNGYQAASPQNHCSVHLARSSSTLEVSGIHIDTVMMVLKEAEKGNDFWRTSILKLWTDHFKTYPTRCHPVHAYIRTATADYDTVSPDNKSRLTEAVVQKIDIVSRRAWNEYITTFKQEMPPRDDNHQNRVTEVSRMYAGFVERRSLTMHSRSFFISRIGYMGIGPIVAEEGDMICILPGCNVPLLIRKEDDYYVLVGECFVWGLMDGEAMEVRTDDNYEVFRLR
jgi:Heterokaryon incompatibility protein (HET)